MRRQPSNGDFPGPLTPERSKAPPTWPAAKRRLTSAGWAGGDAGLDLRERLVRPRRTVDRPRGTGLGQLVCGGVPTDRRHDVVPVALAEICCEVGDHGR